MPASISIELFAGAREAAGAQRVRVLLPESPAGAGDTAGTGAKDPAAQAGTTERDTTGRDATTVGELRKALAAQYPQLGELLEISRFAVDERYADDSETLRLDAEVALIPPVSGG